MDKLNKAKTMTMCKILTEVLITGEPKAEQDDYIKVTQLNLANSLGLITAYGITKKGLQFLEKWKDLK